MNDAEAARLQFVEQALDATGGGSLDIVEQNDALLAAGELLQDVALHDRAAGRAEIIAVDIDREDGDAALLNQRLHALRVAQIRKPEERRDWLSKSRLHGAEAQLDFVTGLSGRDGAKVFVRPGMRADRVAPPRSLAQHLRIGDRHPPGAEEGCLCAMGIEGSENWRRVDAGRSVVEGQDDFAFL